MYKATQRWSTTPPRRSLLALALAQVLWLPAGAVAADADEGNKTELDTVFVTGSRIKRLDGETALPIEITTRDDFRSAA